MMVRFEEICLDSKPDLVLVAGDVDPTIACALTDSGGIQEETTALGIPCLTLRTTTERPVTCEIGTNRLVRPEREPLREAIIDLLDKPRKKGALPPLWDGKAAERIVEIILEGIF
jgi:UDP-N-acetylglucosamine 2-epimerase (non-hydrolysing)